jgi:hypothetical protein
VLRNRRERLLGGLGRFLGAAAHDWDQVVSRIQPDLVEPAEKETERFQETGSRRRMGWHKPIAPHEMIDDRLMAPPAASAGGISEGCPHRLISSIIGPRDRAGQALSRQEMLGIQRGTVGRA